jgi:hypothetical protein
MDQGLRHAAAPQLLLSLAGNDGCALDANPFRQQQHIANLSPAGGDQGGRIDFPQHVA